MEKIKQGGIESPPYLCLQPIPDRARPPRKNSFQPKTSFVTEAAPGWGHGFFLPTAGFLPLGAVRVGTAVYR
jgi:hypothetical protein